MSFFDDPPQPSWDGTRRAVSDWQQDRRPPTFEVPSIMPLAPQLLARTEETAVAATHLRIYQNGFAFLLTLWALGTDGWEHRMPRLGRLVSCPWALAEEELGPAGAIPPEALRFGIQFADGHKTTNLDNWALPQSGSTPDGTATLVPSLIMAGERLCEIDNWVEPLPAAGRLRMAVLWPARSVSETTIEIDGSQVQEAARQATPLGSQLR